MNTNSTLNSPKIPNSPNTKASSSINSSLVKNNILGVEVTNASQELILEYIIKTIENSSKNYYIVTPNPEMVVSASTHPDIKAILNKAELALCDGVGLLWGGQMLKKPFIEKVTGTDTMKKLCEMVAKKPITVGFLGGGPGVAEETVLCLRKMYPSLKVVFAASEWDALPGNGVWGMGYGEEKNHKLSAISHKPKSIDILFVAFGFPKQEIWMAEHLNKIPVRVMMGVGGAFDFISGKVPRAPKIVRQLGLEWLFRLIVQPWRIKRQLALIKFVWLVLRERFRMSSRT